MSELTTTTVILSKSTGTGITQADDGTFTIFVPPEEVTPTTFPKNRYRFSIVITEGDTGAIYPIKRGTITFEELGF